MTRRLLLCLLLLAFAPLGRAAVSYPARLTAAEQNKYPFYLVGQLTFTSGRDDFVASGTVVGVRSILTAGHNVYDADSGFSTKLAFSRKLYGTTNVPVPQLAKRRYVFAQYQSAALKYGADDIRTFARDSAGLVFPKALSGGGRAAFSDDMRYLGSSHYLLGVGYGAEGKHDGNTPLFIHPTAPFFVTYGSFVENMSIYVEGGMSGGPLLSTNQDGVYIQVGIIVSGSTDPVAGGVRMIDRQLKNYIGYYLP